jgi:hypothetical protein
MDILKSDLTNFHWISHQMDHILDSTFPWKIISQITYTPSNNGFYHTDKLFTTADVRRDADLFTTANFSPRIFIR